MDHQTGTAAREPLHILVLQKLEARHREALEQAAADGLYDCRFTWLDSAASATQEDVADADVIIGGVDPALISSAPRLKWLQLSWAGADRYTAPGVLPVNVLLTNASGAYGLSVSEHMLTLTLDLQRRMPRYYRQQAAHTWEMFGPLYSVEGSTILVLGMGDIGGDYARKVKALGASTIGVRRTRKEKPDWLDEQYTLDELLSQNEDAEHDGFDQLLARADIVASVLPGGEQTAHLMDERRLRSMKRGSCIINVGRGNLIVLPALEQVLREGHLAGAALDVTEPEPLPADHPLWDMDNVIITPHVAGQFLVAETFERFVRIAAANLADYTHGRPFRRQVDRRAGY